MKLKFTLLSVAFGMLATLNAQESHVKEYANYLVEIEQSINPKAMNKTWKKRQSSWEEEVQTVSSTDELNKLAEEFTSNLSSKMIPVESMPKLNHSGDYEAYGKSLVNFASALPQDATTINKPDFRTNVIAAGNDFKMAEMKVKANKLKAEIKPDFVNVFQIVFEDAKKGSFSKVADAKIDETTFSVRKKMNLATKAKITIDEEKIYTYQTDVELTDDLQTAKSILKDMIAAILSNTPDEYIESEWIDEAYVDRTIYQYEFEAEIFSVTAKKPTVAIGLVKKGLLYYVVWSVTEPVFKDWKQSNKDWNARDGK